MFYVFGLSCVFSLWYVWCEDGFGVCGMCLVCGVIVLSCV